MTPTDRDMERFFSYVNKTSTCWEWIGSKISRGYGRFWLGSPGRPGKVFQAHRVIWAVTNHRLDILEIQIFSNSTKCVLHHCDNRSCVKPAHLYLGSPKQNTKDMFNRGRDSNDLGLAKLLANNKKRGLQTYCKRGHLLAGDNLKPHSQGHRDCAECYRIRKRARYRRLQAAQAELSREDKG